jgi:hypothetical protein
LGKRLIVAGHHRHGVFRAGKTRREIAIDHVLSLVKTMKEGQFFFAKRELADSGNGR